MNKIRQAAAAAALAIAQASGAATQGLPVVDDRELVALAAAAHAACPSPGTRPSENRYQLLTDARVLAGLESRHQAVCARRPALALRIARALAERPSPDAAAAYKVLGELAPNAGLAQGHLRRAWAIGGAPVVPAAPFASLAERDAYLARADTIAFIRRYVGVRGLPYARLRLAQALLARGRPTDRAAALSLVGEDALAFVPEAEFVRARIGLTDADAAVRRRGLASMRNLAHHPENGGEARALLTAIARRDLGSAHAEDRYEAIRSLAAVAIGGGARERQDLLLAVAAANGGLPPGSVNGAAAEPFARRLAGLLSDDDYPAAALRNAEQGVVTLRGLVDPRGQLVYTEPTAAGQNPRLLAVVRRSYARRRIRPMEIGAARTTPYMWVDLAPVTFTHVSRLRGTVRLPF
ncbi:MAG TPA: hypothetical protein VD887_08995 [Allosphingosinicella sp.]|nr:hypothetical protein [Allosphingosinicella sp.]